MKLESEHRLTLTTDELDLLRSVCRLFGDWRSADSTLSEDYFEQAEFVNNLFETIEEI